MHKLFHILKKEQTIYNIVFHELIRQVSVDCADRGELLSKIRLELLLEYPSFLLNFILELYLYLLLRKSQGFPGGAVVESPPANAGDTGSCPSPGGSHMPRSGWAREPWPLSLRVRSLCSAGEATTVRGPRTAKNKTKQNTKQTNKKIVVCVSLNRLPIAV